MLASTSPQQIKERDTMKKNIASMAVVVMLAAIPAISLSQIPSFPVPGSKPSGDTGGEDLSGQQTGLVKSYVAGGKDVLSSQSKLLEALGLKDRAATAQATSDALGAGATKGELQKADEARSASSTALSETLKNQNLTLGAQSKHTYTQGLSLLASGLIKYTGMKQDVAGFSKKLSGPGAMQPGTTLQSGAYIVKTLPSSISNTSATLSSAVNFAHSHGIEVPPDATAALKSATEH
jgi:hypothetical protein